MWPGRVTYVTQPGHIRDPADYRSQRHKIESRMWPGRLQKHRSQLYTGHRVTLVTLVTLCFFSRNAFSRVTGTRHTRRSQLALFCPIMSHICDTDTAELNQIKWSKPNSNESHTYYMSHMFFIDENKSQPLAPWNWLQFSNSVLQMNWYDVEVPIDTPLPFETSSHSNELCNLHPDWHGGSGMRMNTSLMLKYNTY